jgi:acyl dehydratase
MTPTGFEQFAVGQIFISGARTMDAESIKAFARQFDCQAQHLDEAAARGTMFGTFVASGWHTAAVSMRLMLESVLQGVSGRALGMRIQEIAWPKPVLPGDALHVRNEIVELRPSRSKPDRGIAVIRTTTHKQDGTVVQEMTGTLMILRSDAVLGGLGGDPTPPPGHLTQGEGGSHSAA